ncbi:MAG: DNA mismatch repair protein MutS [Ruminococcaceae bacterium]|nr:DNA mismatch repair protein MutS [Oscillospiraceae bacterium]
MILPKNTEKLSPMMRQYAEIKKNHPDEILFYRLGDFYEMFFDDAILASRELGLVLTGRDCGLDERAPMCGVPHHSSEGYIAKLIEKGFKVAVCEQVEDPALAKGIVKRETLRIITPGTVTENSMLDEGINNYICSMYKSKNIYGLCFADISTGSIHLTEIKGNTEDVFSEFAKFRPKEVLLNKAAQSDNKVVSFLNSSQEHLIFNLYEEKFLSKSFQARIDNLIKKNNNEFEIEKKSAAYKALTALASYVSETASFGNERLTSISYYKSNKYMSMSLQCIRNLEITETIRGREKRGSLLWVIDKTATSSGKRLLRFFVDKPLTDPVEINERLDAVEELVNNSVNVSKIRSILSGVYDTERIMTRVFYNSCTPRDIISLAQTAEKLKELKNETDCFNTKLLNRLHRELDPLEDIKDYIFSALVDDPPATARDGGFIRKGYNSEIDSLRELLEHSKDYLAEMENSLRLETGIKTLKIGFNKIFGYYIEVSRLNSENLSDRFVRKQTLVNSERFITDELKQLENKILSADEKISIIEKELFENIKEYLKNNLNRIQKSSEVSSYLDVLCSFSLLALESSYVRPIVDNSKEILIKGGRHPMVELFKGDELFIPNDTYLDNKYNIVNIITGPNMSGKSTYMRQTALIVLLAQIGCYVPADEAKIGVVDSIFTRIGASDNLFEGDSTFMIEMKEMAYIFKNATKNSLIILDEVGRGTSTYDGMSIARAIIEEIAKKGGLRAKTMFATHYHELTSMDSEFDCIKNYNIAAKKHGDDIIFLRKIVHGPSDDSYGIEVAALAGVPKQVVERSKQLLIDMEMKRGYSRPTFRKNYSDEYLSELAVKLGNIDLEKITPLEATTILIELVNSVNENELPEEGYGN